MRYSRRQNFRIAIFQRSNNSIIKVSSGASDDLQKVRRIARQMVTRFGMSDSFPNYAPVDTEGHNVYSEETAAKIDKEVIKII